MESSKNMKSYETRSLLLSAENIHKHYTIGKQIIPVLNDVSFKLYRGEIVAVVGESGVGKSTLLNVLGTLDRPSQGKVILEGQDLSELDDRSLAALRNQKIGFIFQFHHLLPEFSALENVYMPGLIGAKSLSLVQEQAAELLNQVGLSQRMHHRPNELSGGEQQRVAFARALFNDPLLILGDEPTGNLDHKNSDEVMKIIWKLCRKRNQTFLLVTHNEKLAEQVDRKIELIDGRIKSYL